MGSGLTDDVYEVMPRWRIDENPMSGSVLITQLRPQISAKIDLSLPQWRPIDEWIAPKLRPKWAEMIIPPRLLCAMLMSAD